MPIKMIIIVRWKMNDTTDAMMDTSTEQTTNNTSIKSNRGDNDINSANDGNDTSGTVTSNDAHTGTTA